MDNQKLYTCKEAADILNELTEYMIRKMIKEGTIIPVRLGRNIYVTEEIIHKAVYGDTIPVKKTSSRKKSTV